MNFLLGECFVGLSSLGILCFLGFINDKSLFITDFIIKLLFPILGLFFFMSLSFNNVSVELFNSTLLIDSLFLNIKIILILLLLGILSASLSYFFIDNLLVSEFGLLFLLSGLGTIFVIMCNDFFSLYLALELQNLGFYILAALKKYNSYSVEAGLKYYIMGSLSSGLLLFGFVLLYGLFGTLNFFELSILINNFLFMDSAFFVFWFSFIFIIVGIVFKLGAAPFHWWVPDVYSGAPQPVTLFFATIPKLGLIFIMVKLNLYFSFIFMSLFNIILLSFGVFSLILGFLFALYQWNIMRFIAYSSIFNVGFCLIILSNTTLWSIYSALFFFLPYVSIMLGSILILMVIKNTGYCKNLSIWHLAILGKSNIWLAFSLGILFFSFGGIPPLAGFFSKLFIFISLLYTESYLLLLFVFFLSAGASLYYLRFVRSILFTNTSEYLFIYNLNNLYLISSLIILNVSFFFFYDYFYSLLFNLITYAL